MMAEQRHSQNASQCRSTQNHRCAPCCPPAASAGQHDGAHREALGNFVQENRQKDQPPKPVRYQESGRDRDAVEERMNDQAEQHGVSLVGMNELVVMRFFAKVEVRRDRMLKEVDDEITEEY